VASSFKQSQSLATDLTRHQRLDLAPITALSEAVMRSAAFPHYGLEAPLFGHAQQRQAIFQRFGAEFTAGGPIRLRRHDAEEIRVQSEVSLRAWRVALSSVLQCVPLGEKIYCASGDMENRVKECQLDLYVDRTSTATMAAISCGCGLLRWPMC